MAKNSFSKRAVQRAAEGKSTLKRGQPEQQIAIPFDTHETSFQMEIMHTRSPEQIFANEKDVWSLEKQLGDLKTKNMQYQETISFLLKSLWVVLDPMESLISFLTEELYPIRNVLYFLTFRVGEVTNIWIQLSERVLRTEMEVAAVQSKIFRLFPTAKIQFLVVPVTVANLRKVAPRQVRTISFRKR